ncbi:hypothetical protein D3I60_00045 [Brevibacterium permense]|nr:hypothetical protein [Brevibacterium permense]
MSDRRRIEELTSRIAQVVLETREEDTEWELVGKLDGFVVEGVVRTPTLCISIEPRGLLP